MSEAGDRFREDTLAAQAEEDRDGTQEDWDGWVVMSYIAQNNLATPDGEPLDPVTLRMLEDWSGWTPASQPQGWAKWNNDYLTAVCKPPQEDAGETGETGSEEGRAA